MPCCLGVQPWPQEAGMSLTGRRYVPPRMSNKMDNLEETDTFLDMYNLPRLSQEEIENMNRPVTSNEIESTISFFF